MGATLNIGFGTTVTFKDTNSVAFHANRASNCDYVITANAIVDLTKQSLSGLVIPTECTNIKVTSRDNVIGAIGKLQAEINCINNNSVLSITDDGNGVVIIDNSDPRNPVARFGGVFVDGTTITGDGSQGNPLTSIGNTNYISSVANTATIDLSVSGGGELTADFTSLNISQFTNDANYITAASLAQPNTQVVYGTGSGESSSAFFTWNNSVQKLTTTLYDGSRTLLIDPNSRTYAMGDIDGTLANGLHFILNDDPYPSGIARIMQYSAEYFRIDIGAKEYSIGDLSAVFNGSKFTIDDDNEKYIFNKGSFSISTVDYSFPSSQGAAVTVLTNDGTGSLTWEAISFPSNYISSVADTSTINLTVSGGGELTADFSSMDISQFTNNSGYITIGDIAQPDTQIVYGTATGVSSDPRLSWDYTNSILSVINNSLDEQMLLLDGLNSWSILGDTEDAFVKIDNPNLSITISAGGTSTPVGASIILDCGTQSMLLSANGGVTVDNLAGVGTRMVTVDSTGLLGVSSIPGGTVTSVSGTANRITSTGGTTPIIDISASYVGQSSITTLGTITTGVWNGTAITNANLANSSITIGSTNISLGATSTILAGLTSVTSTTFIGALTGNATTATSLATARTISGTGEATFTTTAFDGSVAVSGAVTLTNSAVIGKVLTGYVSGAGTVSATDSILQAIQKLNGNIAALVSGVSSVFGRTGAVIAVSGDYNTSQVTEVTNLYFTNARAIAATLTGYTSGAGTISSSDSILTAIQKLNGNTAALVTGVSSVSGTANRITTSPTTGAVIVDISASYVGQSSITTLGTIATGVWNATPVTVSFGGTGNTTFTAYSVICAGTTATGTFQNVSGVGSANQKLTSNGAGALPTWQSSLSSVLSCAMGNGNTVALSTTVYAQWFFGSSFQANETNRQIQAVFAGTIKNLYVRTSTAQSGTGSLVVTLRNNTADTTVTLTIAAGAAAGTFTDLVNSFTVAAGDDLSIKIVNNATATSATILEITAAYFS